MIKLVISVISLIGLFLGIASYLITLGLIFIGLSSVILFGHVSILCTFLFIWSSVELGISELENRGDDGIYFYLGKGIILSKIKTDIGKRLYSSKSIAKELNPNFVTGFSDGEGCFYVSITKNKRLKQGIQVRLFFQIGLNEKDKALLEQIKIFFRVGFIDYKEKTKSFMFWVNSLEELKIIIDHFEKYPLMTRKRADYELWKQVFYLMLRGEHRTLEGIQKIVAIRASMNQGIKRSPKLLLAFPDVVPVPKPKVKNQTNQKDPFWLAGFASAEGCFLITIKKSATKLGEAVNLQLVIVQHKKDEQLIQSFINYFGCGKFYIRTNEDICDFKVLIFKDITNKIIPFFQKYPILGIKALDFADWCKVAELMQNKVHLTKEGIDEIKKIKSRMNTGRKI